VRSNAVFAATTVDVVVADAVDALVAVKEKS
jgi:hypothetical protein